MTSQTFPAGATPRVILTNCQSDLTIETWDERSIAVETDGAVETLGQDDEALIIDGAEDDLHLYVPSDTAIAIEDQQGEISVRGVSSLTIVDGNADVEIKAIAGEVRLRDIHSDLKVHGAELLVVENDAASDVEVRDVRTVEIQNVGGDLAIAAVQTAVVGSVGGDCDIKDVGEACRCGSVGGDLRVRGDARTVVVAGQIGGDLAISQAQSVQAGHVGGSAAIRDVAGDLRLSGVGGDCAVERVAGGLYVGGVSGDASFRDNGADLQIGGVGGDLRLSAAFPSESVTRIAVGGDARIDLPDQPNLTVQATVGGSVSGNRIVSTSSGDAVTIIYGDGAARLELSVGGDLSLRGGDTPRVSRSAGGDWAEFGASMGRLGEELGEKLERMGEELEREIEASFGAWGRDMGDKWSHKAHQRAERVRRRVEKQMRRVEERAHHAGKHAGKHAERVHVRINDREWRFDPERLERLKQQARQAAQEGIVGALEAVERALAGMGAPPSPRPPEHPVAPPPAPPTAPTAPRPPSTGETIRIDVEQPDQAGAAGAASEATTPSPAVETERAAILRMVAEGRISPEEGDMLLDALA